MPSERAATHAARDADNAHVALYPSPHLFAIVTWGCAASRWLARTLNGHPDLFCVHELNSEIASLLQIERPDGLEYFRLLGVQGNGYAAAGDVHGVSRSATTELRAALGDSISFAALVREPEQRLLSQLALFRQFATYPPAWEIDYVDAIIDEEQLALPDDSILSRLFVHGANMLNAVCEEAQIGPVFCMEEITTRAGTLRDLIAKITAEKVVPGLAWCRQAVRTRATNGHRADRAAGLEPWQREVVRRAVRPEAWKLYDELGYARPGWL